MVNTKKFIYFKCSRVIDIVLFVWLCGQVHRYLWQVKMSLKLLTIYLPHQKCFCAKRQEKNKANKKFKAHEFYRPDKSDRCINCQRTFIYDRGDSLISFSNLNVLQRWYNCYKLIQLVMVTGLFAGQHNTKLHGTITGVIFWKSNNTAPML